MIQLLIYLDHTTCLQGMILLFMFYITLSYMYIYFIDLYFSILPLRENFRTRCKKKKKTCGQMGDFTKWNIQVLESNLSHNSGRHLLLCHMDTFNLVQTAFTVFIFVKLSHDIIFRVVMCFFKKLTFSCVFLIIILPIIQKQHLTGYWLKKKSRWN